MSLLSSTFMIGLSSPWDQVIHSPTSASQAAGTICACHSEGILPVLYCSVAKCMFPVLISDLWSAWLLIPGWYVIFFQITQTWLSFVAVALKSCNSSQVLIIYSTGSWYLNIYYLQVTERICSGIYMWNLNWITCSPSKDKEWQGEFQEKQLAWFSLGDKRNWRQRSPGHNVKASSLCEKRTWDNRLWWPEALEIRRGGAMRVLILYLIWIPNMCFLQNCGKSRWVTISSWYVFF